MQAPASQIQIQQSKIDSQQKLQNKRANVRQGRPNQNRAHKMK